MLPVRPAIAALTPYVPGEQPDGTFVKLNANENPYPPSPRVLEAVARATGDQVRLYPDALSRALRAVAARAFGVGQDWVIAGNGSDDVLTMIVRTFLDPGDTIAVVDPTYTLYETLAAMQGAHARRYPLTEQWELPEAFFGAPAQVTFLPNPNAQTGTLFSAAAIRRLCAAAQGVLVLDEAYAPFAGVTYLPLVREFPHLIVLRTLSKSHALAGLRVGFGVAQPDVIALLMKVKDSYNLNAISQVAGIAALEDTRYVEERIAAIVRTREAFARALAERGWELVPSAANFVLAAPPGGQAREVVVALEQRGYLVRHFATPRLERYVRFSIGTDEQMDGLVAALDACRATWSP
ncbi:MAG: histidinol-phosphate transaminase [bacterium]|nr:histidinol-phosphate transaminase [bacterium]